jgi:hypothetical protein
MTPMPPKTIPFLPLILFIIRALIACDLVTSELELPLILPSSIYQLDNSSSLHLDRNVQRDGLSILEGRRAETLEE